MDINKIYLAIPYTNNPELSFHVASKVAAELISNGEIIYSPISHSHPIATIGGLKTDYNTWRRIDEVMIDWCDSVWVVQLDGWEKSSGIKEEVKYAQNLNKNILYLPEDMLFVKQALCDYYNNKG